MLVLEHAGFGPTYIGVGHALKRERQRFDGKVVDRELVSGLTVLVLRCDGVDLLACLQKLADIAIDREIKMRDGLHRSSEPRCDCAPHAVMRDDFVAAVLIERADLLVAHCRRDHWRRSWRGRCPGRRPQTTPFSRRRHVTGDNAAMRAGSLDAANFDPRLFGEAARQGRRKNTRAGAITETTAVGTRGLARAWSLWRRRRRWSSRFHRRRHGRRCGLRLGFD